MKVTDTRKFGNTIDFGCLDCGDVFEDEDRDICMKIDNSRLDDTSNAVILTTGATFRCCMDTPVVLLNAELTIKEDK